MSGPRALTGRERRLLGGVGLIALLLVVGVGVSLITLGGSSSPGCIDFAFAYSTGGQQVHRCGATARQTCAGANISGGYTAQARGDLVRACRRAGLPT